MTPETDPCKEWSKIGQEFTMSINGCARCWGDGHDDLVWLPLTHMIDCDGYVATHWCLCPTNGQPILMSGCDD